MYAATAVLDMGDFVAIACDPDCAAVMIEISRDEENPEQYLTWEQRRMPREYACEVCGRCGDALKNS